MIVVRVRKTQRVRESERARTRKRIDYQVYRRKQKNEGTADKERQ